MKPKTIENEDQVRLKPIMGIRPGVYLTALYSIILLFIIFLLLFLPGIRNTQIALIVKTQPAGAAIRVNDIYMGLSGSRIIIPAGIYTIEAIMPGFEGQSSVHEIPGRVFASRFFPRRYRIEKTLTTADPLAAFALYINDFASWTFAGEATEIWQIPLSLSEGVYRLGKELNSQDFQDMLKAASRFTVTRAALRDLIRAKALLDNKGNPPSPSTLLGSISDVLLFLSQNPGSASWLSRLLPGTPIRVSQWVLNELDIETSFIPDNPNQTIRQFQLSGLTFINMDEGRLFSGSRESYINSFMISENPVPRSLFEDFLNENPQWREHQRDYFPLDISTLPLETYNRFMYGVTWYAAQAFCEWLTRRLPPSMAGMEIRLPTEDEWEYASLSISSMLNAGWEWCADPFAPLNFITASAQAIEAVGSPERSLRGRQTPAQMQTRASLPPEFSSPFVTFRTVISARR